ncbi:hypothetical protein NM208_g16641 [Fusarium decemcellulare]|uniref:Uncharacterized protein n=1 Tax=Fusarium decemcellulare TaxID=57161 RepID=A0ACC1RBI5_9HYPO|nr:hypothetical protein NM208_g16641 [Fusarium decemcellulare]
MSSTRAEDDEAIVQWIREHVETTWHSIATCKMAPREEKGVVDKNLNVYGTKGLKLADLSIPPSNVGGNTNNTAMLIGEKAADIIINELGLSIGRSESTYPASSPRLLRVFSAPWTGPVG